MKSYMWTSVTRRPGGRLLSTQSTRFLLRYLKGAQMRSLHKSTEDKSTSKEENTKKHFKDRPPDQMKDFKQVSLNLIFNI